MAGGTGDLFEIFGAPTPYSKPPDIREYVKK
jgi:hypothetical protein